MLLEQTERTVILHLCDFQGFEGKLLVLHQSLHGEVGEYDGAGVAHHAVGLRAHKMPYGEASLLLVDIEECLCEVALHLGEGDSHQRMSGAVCVPERECGVVGEVSLVHLSVCATILEVNVVELRA